jgi:hypothetical protein
VTKTNALTLSQEQELLSVTVARANAWISSSGVSVINVETVVLPVITSEYIYTTFDQIVRVWYEDTKPPA